MSNIVYNFPAMFQQAQSMKQIVAQLVYQAQVIAQEQKSLATHWEGQTAESYQLWQQQWNNSCQNMIQAYSNMANTYEDNTQQMLAQENGLARVW